jgi:hypothetical protein
LIKPTLLSYRSGTGIRFIIDSEKAVGVFGELNRANVTHIEVSKPKQQIVSERFWALGFMTTSPLTG